MTNVKFTHNRHLQICEIDIDAMFSEDLLFYCSLRPIRGTRQEAERGIEMLKPQKVYT